MLGGEMKLMMLIPIITLTTIITILSVRGGGRGGARAEGAPLTGRLSSELRK